MKSDGIFVTFVIAAVGTAARCAAMLTNGRAVRCSDRKIPGE